jgi:hypothetical protein
MDETRGLSDEQIERLLSGRLQSDSDAPEIARFLTDFQDVYPEPSIDSCEASHLAAIFATARKISEEERGVTRPATGTARPWSIAPRGGGGKSSWPAWRLPRRAGAKLAVAIVVMLFAFGGVAAASGFVYHQTSGAGSSTTLTQPGPNGMAPETSLEQPAGGEVTSSTDTTVGAGDERVSEDEGDQTARPRDDARGDEDPDAHEDDRQADEREGDVSVDEHEGDQRAEEYESDQRVDEYEVDGQSDENLDVRSLDEHDGDQHVDEHQGDQSDPTERGAD